MEQVKKEIISRLQKIENNEFFNNLQLNGQEKEQNPHQQQKSLENAQNLRKEGNRIYATCHSPKDFHNAYKFYAKSIAHAPAKSEEMALAYSNLSAVLLRLDRNSECLQAIESCFNSGYPEKSKFKIYLRKIECLKIIGKNSKAKNVYVETLAWIEQNQTDAEQKTEMKKKLEECYKKNVEVKKPFTEKEYREVWKDFSIKKYSEEIPGASDAICLKYSEDQGRHYVATRDIRPGEIIMEARPYISVCSKEFRYMYCWECGKFTPNCIPCDVCNNVIFCSFKCKKDAWKNYHRQECKVLQHMFNIPGERKEFKYFQTHFVSAVRVLFRSIHEYGSFKNLRQFLDELDQVPKDPRTIGFSNGKLLDDKYVGFYSLKWFDDFPYEQNNCISEIVYKLATSTTLFGKKVEPSEISRLTGNEDMVFAACLIVKHMHIIETNCIESTVSETCIHVGLKLSILKSLFNHSCLNNIQCNDVKACETALAILPIKKGEKVLWNYFEGYSKTEARRISQDKYYFTCNCEACTNNWPENYTSSLTQEKSLAVYEEVRSVMPRDFDTGVFSNDEKFSNAMKNRTFRNNLLKFYSTLIDKFVAYNILPCKEVFFTQKAMISLNNCLNNSNYDEYCQ